MSHPRKVPPYSEAEVTTWLAWLADHMRQRDMTIFQIESLQPDWLTGWKESMPHLLLTRTLWALWSGLLFGLFIGSSYLLNGRLIIDIDRLFFALNRGLLFGFSVGLSELVIPLHKLDKFLRSQTHSNKGIAAGALIFRLSGGLMSGLAYGLARGLILGLLFGLSVGLIGGFVRTSRVTLREISKRIRTIESLRWSWQGVRTNAGKGTLFGLLFGLFFGLFGGLSAKLLYMQLNWLAGGDWRIGRLTDWLMLGLIMGLLFGLFGGLFGGLLGGFQPGAEELKTRPNQGIWLTIKSALKIGLSAGGLVGGLSWLVSGSIAIGLLYVIVTTLIIGGWYGGLDVIEHYLVRLIIAWRGHAPINYARFLDYAADELNFLQKVGGGYIFIHRYLLEHFADMAAEQGVVARDTAGRSR